MPSSISVHPSSKGDDLLEKNMGKGGHPVLKGDVVSAEIEIIKQTVLGYIEAWVKGEPERGEKSLHPELAKRIVRVNPETGKDKLEGMSAAIHWAAYSTRRIHPDLCRGIIHPFLYSPLHGSGFSEIGDGHQKAGIYRRHP
jgi:hypothetical protein